MDFSHDAFISYSHIDNQILFVGRNGWISNFHRSLKILLDQKLGDDSSVWRDPKLDGNDVFEQTLVTQLQQVAALIAIISPRYVKSEWTRRELTEFLKAAEDQGGVSLHDKARIFKVLKTPIPRALEPPELQPLLGYEFYRVEEETGRVEEWDEVFGPAAQPQYWKKLNDVADDVVALLKLLQEDVAKSGTRQGEKAQAVFLAETTSDLREERDALRRDLRQHGYTVLPDRSVPLLASEMKRAFAEDLAKCKMSIHPVGKRYGLVPEGSKVSMLEIENELAIERGLAGSFVRLLWIPKGLEAEDERQVKVIDCFRTDARLQAGADLLETPFETLRTVIHERLNESLPAEKAGGNGAGLYLLYDQRDTESVSAYADALFDRGFEVLHPTFTGDETEIRLSDEENLRMCEGIVIFFGSSNELWVRRKLRELKKSVGYGRTGPLPPVVICCVGTKTAEKDRFRTHEAPIVMQLELFSADAVERLLALLAS